MLNQNAAHQLTTVNPVTSVAASLMISILITSKNNPSETMVTGYG